MCGVVGVNTDPERFALEWNFGLPKQDPRRQQLLQNQGKQDRRRQRPPVSAPMQELLPPTVHGADLALRGSTVPVPALGRCPRKQKGALQRARQSTVEDRAPSCCGLPWVCSLSGISNTARCYCTCTH